MPIVLPFSAIGWSHLGNVGLRGKDVTHSSISTLARSLSGTTLRQMGNIDIRSNNKIVGPQLEALVLNQTLPIYDSSFELPKNAQVLLKAQDIEISWVENLLQNNVSARSALTSYHLMDSLRLLRGIRGSAQITVILSPGRSGTVSLFYLFNDMGNFHPYHNIPLAISGTIISEFFYRGLLNKFNSSESWDTQGSICYYYDIYIRSRVVELMHSSIAHVVICNNYETWFSPIIANVFENSKFLYLERNPVDTIYSLLLSDVHGRKQDLREIVDTINTATPLTIEEASKSSNLLQMDIFGDDQDNSISARLNSTSPLDMAVWQYKQVKVLATALQKTLPSERFMSISADRLFAKDFEEIERFMEFFKLDKDSSDRIHRHFDTKINSKGKIVNSRSDGEIIREIIREKFY